MRRFGFEEPCASWQVMQSPRATLPCWKTNGPRFSVWQLTHGSSPERVTRIMSRPRPLPCGSWQDEHSIPPRPRRCANGLLRNEAACDEWQEAQSASCGFTSRFGVCASAEWIEWHVRQLTVVEFAWGPVWREMRSVAMSWHARHVLFDPSRPTGLKIFVLSPPASMCACPGPWQVSHTAFGTTPLTAFPCACGFVANATIWSWWQSPHDIAGAGSGDGEGGCCARAPRGTSSSRSVSPVKTERFMVSHLLPGVHLVNRPVLPCSVARCARLGRSSVAAEGRGVQIRMRCGVFVVVAAEACRGSRTLRGEVVAQRRD